MKKLLLIFILLIGVTFVRAQNVNIPDAKFKSYLLANTAINTNGDSEIQLIEATNFTEDIYCQSRDINDLTGIEAFVNLKGLYCFSNNLSILDVSKNTKLEILSCSANRLVSLDLNKNTDLFYLSCQENFLISLDITKNKSLQVVNCFQNHLTSLDVSQNSVLGTLSCFSNQITSLKLDDNKFLTVLFCRDNKLVSLNIKNGQNSALTNFDARGNPNLSCIQVDNITNANNYALNGNWKKDVAADYNTNCLLSADDINKIRITIYPNPVKDFINFSHEVFNIKITDVSGKLVKQIPETLKSINISNLAKGNYIINVTTKTGEVINKKFIKK